MVLFLQAPFVGGTAQPIPKKIGIPHCGARDSCFAEKKSPCDPKTGSTGEEGGKLY
jgi:hypothetical protein